jgi:hypothetical protein
MADILVKMSEKEREESKVREVLEKKQKFDAIANTMCEVGGYGTRIWLDCFRKEKDGGIYEFIILEWEGGGINARYVSDNSLSADLRELTACIDGGHYDQLQFYKRVKKGSTPLEEER